MDRPPLQPPVDAEAILANARALAPLVREQSDEIEAQRRLPEPVIGAMRDAGVLRIAMPRAWGGPELDPTAQIEVIEILSRADASAGWCASILSDSGFYASYLDDAVARKIFPRLDMGAAGMLQPVGRAKKVEGGYVVSGRWAFGSGCLHADVLTGGALITEDDGTPVLLESGVPLWRVFILPRGEVEIHDTWHTTGLAGSGSNDYSVQDVFVPEEHTFDVFGNPNRTEPLYNYHGLFFANVPGIPLGLARHALDEVRELVATKLSIPSLQPLSHDERVQRLYARAEGVLRSARSYCYDEMASAWSTLSAGDELDIEQRAGIALMLVHVAQAAGEVVELACEIAGSTALYERHPLERIRRDMIAVGSHVVHQAKTYKTIGRSLLGLPPEMSFF